MGQNNNAALVTNLSPFFQMRGESPIFDISNLNTSNPPLNSELDSAFGVPGSGDIPDGWSTVINDNGSGLNYYLVVAAGTDWLIFTAAVAA